MRLGALDYLVKPFLISRSCRWPSGGDGQTKQTARLDEHAASRRRATHSFFGGSLARWKISLEKIIAADNRMQERLSPVLIRAKRARQKPPSLVGCTGRGRGRRSRWWKSTPGVARNAGRIGVFGHERGASGRPGTRAHGIVFEAANGGTLFLDELPSLSLGLQAKVLHVD